MLALTTEAWCTPEGESQRDDGEKNHEDGDIDNADDLPTVEPNLATQSQRLHGAPESMGEMEPDGNEPNEVKHYEDRVGECLLNPTKTIGGIEFGFHPHKLCKHHVVPEVEQVEQEAQQNDDAQHEHVLA